MTKIDIYDNNYKVLEAYAEENDTTIAEVIDDLVADFLKGQNAASVYKYGMRLRGYSLGCQPMDGLVKREDGVKINGRYYHDILVYSRKLSDKEIKNYELDYLGSD